MNVCNKFESLSLGKPNVCEAKAYPSEAPFMCFTLGWAYAQTYHWAGKACQGQSLYLIMNIRK